MSSAGYDPALVGYIAFILLALFPLVVYIVYMYAEPGFPWHTYLTLILGFYASFGIMLMIPIDIAVVIHDRGSRDEGHDAGYDYDVNVLSAVYNTFFTIVLVLGSVVLVFEEYYNTDGYFTVKSRLWSSFKRMSFDLAVPGVVGLIILGILMGQHVVSSNASALKLTLIILTNTTYEAFLMILLGYSLVEFPRTIWSQSDLDYHLLKTQMRASQQFKDISDAQLSVSLAVSDVLKTKNTLNSANPELVAAMDVLLADCPPEFRSDRLGKVAADKDGKVTIDSLAKLRTRLNVLKDAYRMAQAKVEGTKLLSYTLEDLVAAKNNPASQSIHWSLTDKDSSPREFFWHIRVKPVLLKIAAIACALLSVLSLLGVICSMSGVSNGVSPYFLAVHGPNIRPVGICIFILVTFGYTVYITTWAIFEIKLGAAFELVPGRTTPEALSFNARAIARFAAPLAFFYLGWISENGIRTGDWTKNDAPNSYEMRNVTVVVNGTPTVELQNVTISNALFMPSGFSHFYQLQSVNSVQEVFGTIFPVILFVVMALFIFNIFNRLLVFLKMDSYQFGAQIVTEEQLREGKRQLQRNKDSSIRAYRRGEFRNRITSATNRNSNASNAEAEERGFSLFAFFRPRAANNAETARETIASEEKPSIKEPGALNGPLEKKGAFSLGAGGGWKEFYGEIRSPGFLHFYKDRKTADQNRFTEPSKSSDSQATVVDLRAIVDFKIADKKGKEAAELDLELGDETIRLRFKTAAELQRWKAGLIEWKDFNLDFGATYPNGVGDLEGSAGKNSSHSLTANNVTISPMSRATNDLDAIHIGEEDEDDEKGNRPLMKSARKKKADEPVSKPPSFTPSKPAATNDDKPPALEGWLEKKGSGMMGSDWQKRFVRVDEATGSLLYFKSSDPKEKPAGSVDLKLAKEVTPYEKNGKPDYSRFNVDAGDSKAFKFRAKDNAEGQRWVDGLNAWRDHFLLNMI